MQPALWRLARPGDEADILRLIRALATFHPAYLLRSPSYKRMAWQDFSRLWSALESTSITIGPLFLKAFSIISLASLAFLIKYPFAPYE